MKDQILKDLWSFLPFMYECRCPKDNKKLAEIARPPLSGLSYIYHCSCGQSVKAQIEIDKTTQHILAIATCDCGDINIHRLGYLIKIKCDRCKTISLF